MNFTQLAQKWETEAEALTAEAVEANDRETGHQADAIAQCAAELRGVIDYQREEAPAVVIVDGEAYPVDLGAITAAQTVWMRRDLAVSPGEMVTRLAVSLAELPEIVALMALSIEQTGGTVDLAELMGRVTLSSVVDFVIDDALIDVDDSAVRAEVEALSAAGRRAADTLGIHLTT